MRRARARAGNRGGPRDLRIDGRGGGPIASPFAPPIGRPARPGAHMADPPVQIRHRAAPDLPIKKRPRRTRMARIRRGQTACLDHFSGVTAPPGVCGSPCFSPPGACGCCFSIFGGGFLARPLSPAPKATPRFAEHTPASANCGSP